MSFVILIVLFHVKHLSYVVIRQSLLPCSGLIVDYISSPVQIGLQSFYCSVMFFLLKILNIFFRLTTVLEY